MRRTRSLTLTCATLLTGVLFAAGTAFASAQDQPSSATPDQTQQTQTQQMPVRQTPSQAPAPAQSSVMSEDLQNQASDGAPSTQTVGGQDAIAYGVANDVRTNVISADDARTEYQWRVTQQHLNVDIGP